jgi:hypothetical protein
VAVSGCRCTCLFAHALCYRTTSVFVLPSTQALVPFVLPKQHAFHLLSPICPRDHAMFWNHTCQLFMMVQACTLHLLPLSIPVALLHCIYTSLDTSIQFVTLHEVRSLHSSILMASSVTDTGCSRLQNVSALESRKSFMLYSSWSVGCSHNRS